MRTKKRLNFKSILLFTVIVLAVIFGVIYFERVRMIVGRMLRILRPFLWGAAIAFLLNLPVKFFDRKFMQWRGRQEKWMRPISILLSLLVFLAIIFFVVFLALPDLQETLTEFVRAVPEQMQRFGRWLTAWVTDHPQVVRAIQSINITPEEIQRSVRTLLTNAIDVASLTVRSLFNFTFSFAFFVIDISVALVFGIVLIFNKESMIRHFKKLIYAVLSRDWGHFVVNVGKLTNAMFSGFVSGQCKEAVILGTLCYLGMLIFRFPFSLSISVLMGVTAFVPFYGAFIGGALGALLIGVQNFIAGLWFIVFIIVIQQIESNLFYPRVVGGSVGLPTAWTLATVTIFGALFGVIGMLTSVPLTATLYRLLRANINHTLDEKNITVTVNTDAPAKEANEALTEAADQADK